MAKSRPARKSGGKARKPAKAKQTKVRSAKPQRKPAGQVAAKGKVGGSGPKARKQAPVVEIPEIPPPLPAPIASFTF